MSNPVSVDRPSTFRRRVRVWFRLSQRRLLRIEPVESDSRGNAKTNPIRCLT